jgi:uncharacterized protein
MPESNPIKKFRDLVVRQFHALMQIHDTPHAIAGGVAIGIFFGFTPLFSVKTLLAILIAWIFRCSKISAALAVTFHDILLPVWPVVMRQEYKIGYWLLISPHHMPPKIRRDVLLNLEHFFHWSTFVNIVWPMLVGSVVIGAPVAGVSFFVTEKIVAHYQKKRAAKQPVVTWKNPA